MNDDDNYMLTKQLLSSFKPLFREMNTYSKRCLSMESIVYLNFFNMLLDIYITKVSNNHNINVDNIFDNDNSFLTDFIDIFFYDEFDKNLFFDIFDKALKELNIASKNKKQSIAKSQGNKQSEEDIKIANLIKFFDYNKNANQDDKALKVYYFYKINFFAKILYLN